MLKPEQVQAVCHMYEGRDVFLWLLTGFVNPLAMKFSLILRPSHKVTMCEGPGYEAKVLGVPVHLVGKGFGCSSAPSGGRFWVLQYT